MQEAKSSSQVWRWISIVSINCRVSRRSGVRMALAVVIKEANEWNLFFLFVFGATLWKSNSEKNKHGQMLGREMYFARNTTSSSKAYSKKKQKKAIPVSRRCEHHREQEKEVAPQVRWRVLRKSRIILALSVHGGDALGSGDHLAVRLQCHEIHQSGLSLLGLLLSLLSPWFLSLVSTCLPTCVLAAMLSRVVQRH